MKQTTIQRAGIAASIVLSAFALTIVPAAAIKAREGVAAPDSASSASSAKDTAKLKLVINRGNAEINRRLNTLNKLTTKINGSTKLSDANKAALTAEVTAAIDSLNSLKTELNADTTVAEARADAQRIIQDYRVYALLVPKVNLAKTADDQLNAETKLLALAPKLQSRIDQAKASGKQVDALQNGLNDLQAKATAAQTTSTNVQNSVISLQPSDYNSDHKVLSDYRTQLITAQSNIKAALADAKTILSGLKNQ